VTSDVLKLDQGPWQEMLAHAYDGLPLEACGLLAACSLVWRPSPSLLMHPERTVT